MAAILPDRSVPVSPIAVSLWVALLLFIPSIVRTAQDARYQSAHFLVHAARGQDVSGLLEELESAYRDVQAYGLSLPRTVIAYCYPSTAEFTRRSHGEAFHLALASQQRLHLQPLRVLLRDGNLARTLRHELTHVALAAAAERGLPRWLNEGMAMIVAGERHPQRITFRSLRQLEDTLLRSRSHDNLRSAYGTAARLTERLVNQLGRERTLALLRTVGSRGQFEQAFGASVGSSLRLWEQSELGR